MGVGERATLELEELRTSDDAARAVADASAGPCWDQAAAAGIDMTLLLRNLRRTPAERIAHAAAHRRAVAAMQARTVPRWVRLAAERDRRAEKAAALEAIVGR